MLILPFPHRRSGGDRHAAQRPGTRNADALSPECEGKLTVITKSGETFTGTLTHKDEFHIAMTDSEGWSRSWPIRAVEYKIDSLSDAHIEQFEKYTDDDIHNLMAYLQTLR